MNSDSGRSSEKDFTKRPVNSSRNETGPYGENP